MSEQRPAYGSDPYAYDFAAALEEARERVRARRRRPGPRTAAPAKASRPRKPARGK